MLRRGLCSFVVLLLLSLTVAADGLVHGAGFVRDADTLEVGGVFVRLEGVDAPELGTPEGEAARAWLMDYLSGKQVECRLTGEQTYDRYVGVCWADGQDLGAAVISAGHALDCARYSRGRYHHLETPAAVTSIRRSRYC